jgi:outer membrane protein OmpA-like peptidoglycan-associated protein
MKGIQFDSSVRDGRLKLIALLVALLTIAGLAGCATTPQRNDQLEQARGAVQDLEQDPEAERAAAEQLRAARSDLQRADAAFANHRPPEEVTYLAYIAQREAQAGKQYADEYRARQQLARGNEERSHILLEARNREVRQAQEAAQAQAQNAQIAQQQAQAANSQLQKEQQELSSMKARETARGLELTLASDLLFDTGSATLKPGAMLQLNRLADFMQGNPKTRIIIEGYTDNQGSEAYNEELSQRRAQSVGSALETQGIPAERIQTVGRGKDYPVASNAISAGRQQNRRVDIVLSDMSGRFAQAATQAPMEQ